MEKILHDIFLRTPTNLWDEFEAECRRFYDAPAHSFVEMRTRDNKKIRGDIFEDFCVVYLQKVRGYTNVWRLQDVPDDILEKLSVARRDFGIDIIAEKDGKYTAIQCKYKKQTGKTNIVTWKALSTFYALCMRTGPWDKYIVMTNCTYVRHMGKKTPKDLSICLRTLCKITKEQWTQMCNLGSHAIEETKVTKPKTPEELRAARLAFLTKLSHSSSSVVETA
jgi:predicted helicase